jgi:MFS family permease
VLTQQFWGDNRQDRQRGKDLFKNSYLRGNLVVLAVSGAFTNLGAGIIGLFLPEYFRRLGGNTLILGLMTSVQFFALFLGGFIADHYGRRKILVLTAFYGVLFPLLYAIVQDWRLFALIGAFAAIGSVSAPAYHAIVADSVAPEKRATGISALQVFSSMPLIVVPLIWGWLINNLGWIEGFKIGSIYSIATALASAFIILFFLKETGRKAQATITSGSQDPKSINPMTSFSEKKSFWSTSLKALIIAYCLIIFANAAVGQYYIIYATEVIQLTALEWSLIVSLQYLSAIILKIPGAWAADKFGKKKVLVISALTCAPFTIIFTISQSFVQVMIVMLLLVVAGIYYAPVHEALQADLTPRWVRGRITMLWSIGSAVAAATGAIVGGLLFQTVSPTTPFYLFTAAELIAVVLLVVAVKEPLKKEE